MIQVTYHRKYHKLTIEGHAHSGEAGHDLVCASASILAYTLAASVANMSAAKQIREPVIRLDPGDAEISCKTIRRFEAPVTLIFDTICGGYELLARDYPENIHYEVRG